MTMTAALLADDHADKQRAEAHDILVSCTTATWRPLVAWAAGVYVAQHALHLYTLPIPPRSLAPELSGGNSRGRYWDADRKSFRIREYAKHGPDDALQEREILALKWPEIERLLTLDLVGAPLHEQIRVAMHTRRERTQRWDPRRSGDWHKTPAAQLERQLWWEIEDECYRLGALAWRRCRPVPPAAPKPAVQLGLFDFAA